MNLRKKKLFLFLNCLIVIILKWFPIFMSFGKNVIVKHFKILLEKFVKCKSENTKFLPLKLISGRSFEFVFPFLKMDSS